MKKLRVVFISVAAALAFGGVSFAQQTQQASPDPQPQAASVAPAQQVPQSTNQFGPAAVVINKLVTMQDSGKFPVTQEELDRATEFLMNKAKAEGLTVTRDESLVGMGFIAGSLATFMDIQRQAAEMVSQAPTPLPPEVMPTPNVEQQSNPSAPQATPQGIPQGTVLIPVQPAPVQPQQVAPVQNAPVAQQ